MKFIVIMLFVPFLAFAQIPSQNNGTTTNQKGGTPLENIRHAPNGSYYIGSKQNGQAVWTHIDTIKTLIKNVDSARIVNDTLVLYSKGISIKAGYVKGNTGPQGPIGFTGLQGPIGNTGPQGLTGATGATGPQGPQGITGATGAQGLQGLTGAIGATGLQGPQGLTGVTGATGAQGPQGLKGDTGAQGPIGIQGPIGLTGTTVLDSTTVGNTSTISLSEVGNQIFANVNDGSISPLKLSEKYLTEELKDTSELNELVTSFFIRNDSIYLQDAGGTKHVVIKTKWDSINKPSGFADNIDNVIGDSISINGVWVKNGQSVTTPDKFTEFVDMGSGQLITFPDGNAIEFLGFFDAGYAFLEWQSPKTYKLKFNLNINQFSDDIKFTGNGSISDRYKYFIQDSLKNRWNNDTSKLNEIITSLNKSGNNLTIIEAGVSRTFSVADSDSLPNNEFNTNFYRNNDTLFISDGGGLIFAKLPASIDTTSLSNRIDITRQAIIDSSARLQSAIIANIANGSETKINSSSTVNIVGAGTISSPYSASVADGSITQAKLSQTYLTSYNETDPLSVRLTGNQTAAGNKGWTGTQTFANAINANIGTGAKLNMYSWAANNDGEAAIQLSGSGTANYVYPFFANMALNGNNQFYVNNSIGKSSFFIQGDAGAQFQLNDNIRQYSMGIDKADGSSFKISRSTEPSVLPVIRIDGGTGGFRFLNMAHGGSPKLMTVAGNGDVNYTDPYTNGNGITINGSQINVTGGSYGQFYRSVGGVPTWGNELVGDGYNNFLHLRNPNGLNQKWTLGAFSSNNYEGISFYNHSTGAYPLSISEIGVVRIPNLAGDNKLIVGDGSGNLIGTNIMNGDGVGNFLGLRNRNGNQHVWSVISGVFNSSSDGFSIYQGGSGANSTRFIINHSGQIAIPNLSGAGTRMVVVQSAGELATQELPTTYTSGSGISIIDGVITNTGLAGPQGPQGLTGATGATGPQGIQGLTGATGATGPQGPTANVVYNLSTNFANNTITPTVALSAPLIAGLYKIEVIGSYQTDITTTGCRINFSATAGLVSSYQHGIHKGMISNANVNTENAIGITALTTQLVTTGVSVINTAHNLHSNMVINVTNPGTLNLNFGSEIAASNAILLTGTTMIVTKLN